MKHVFIINPAAGKHDRTAAVTAEVARCCAGMDYEIAVSDDFAFDKLLSTIRGDVEMGADVVVPGGFVALTIPASA